MRGEEMKRFWDARAREDALFFVDNDLRYGDPDQEWFWARGTEVVDTICEELGVRLDPADRVVEIGCGVGRLTRELAARTARVDALDVSAEMLDLAREYNPGLENVSWLQGDGESLAGIADAGADVCFSHVVFQHIPDPAITLGYVSEMGRVLADGGWAAFQISNLPALHRRRRLRERLESGLRAALRRGPRGQMHPAWRGSAIDLDQLRATASEAGMSVERIVGEGTQFCLVRLSRGPR
jgi:SAM-dependent methyltransferase